MSHPRLISGDMRPGFNRSARSYALAQALSNPLFKRGREHTAIPLKRKTWNFRSVAHWCGLSPRVRFALQLIAQRRQPGKGFGVVVGHRVFTGFRDGKIYRFDAGRAWPGGSAKANASAMTAFKVDFRRQGFGGIVFGHFDLRRVGRVGHVRRDTGANRFVDPGGNRITRDDAVLHDGCAQAWRQASDQCAPSGEAARQTSVFERRNGPSSAANAARSSALGLQRQHAGLAIPAC